MFCKHKFKYFSGTGGSDFYRICAKCGKVYRREVTYEGLVEFHSIKPGHLILRMLSNLPELKEVNDSWADIYQHGD